MDAKTTLSEIMTTDLIIVKPTDKVKAVADAFRKNDIHHLPVVDEGGQLVGIISKTDFLKISYGWSMFRHAKREEYDNALYESLLVRDVMTKEVAKLSPDDAISVAVGIFKENLFHAIPIVEKGLLVGIITTYDLLNYAFQDVAASEGR
ncbi:MAG: CBS domain-containing protein [Saprospiraceae bacterium]|nr:CBS domain-containing protein [Saprospiraceae bacterium]MCB0622779.1 CBS domain-containing protein [Saprospiraceae bacterium]MCB0682360.1 CBS domain-containing protein [Saprospiraceae bacterium]